MKYPTRPITAEEKASAGVQPVELNRADILATLAQFNYVELQPAKEVIEATSTLTVDDIYKVWGAVSKALDLHSSDNQGQLDELESECAEIVTSAWDKQMELSDRTERQQNVAGCYEEPKPQPAPDSNARMLKKISGGLEWVALAIFVLAIVQCSTNQPKQHTQSHAVTIPATDYVALVKSTIDAIEAKRASDDHVALVKSTIESIEAMQASDAAKDEPK